MLPKVHYNGKISHKNRCTPSLGVIRYLNQFQLSLHKIFITYTSLHIVLEMYFTFSTESCGNVISPNKTRESASMGLQKELICLVSIFSRPTNDHRCISSFPSNIGWMSSQLLKYLKLEGFAFSRTSIC